MLERLLRMFGWGRGVPIQPLENEGAAARLIGTTGHNLCFTSVEVGALPIDVRPEPFHSLIRSFPGSRNIAFEVDDALCAQLNASAMPGMEFHACALGRAHETRTFYATAHPMCASLYEPNERWFDLFQALEVMRKTHEGTINVTTLERFAAENGVAAVDFIKMDIQGAELELLQGAGKILDSVLCIVCEVGFVDLYRGQPLYGDIDAFLRGRGFMFHKFLGLAGRTMKPMVIDDNPCFPVQVMWADAVFVRDLREPQRLSDEQLLKLAVYMEIYGSIDVSRHLLAQFDRRVGTSLAEKLLKTGVNRES